MDQSGEITIKAENSLGSKRQNATLAVKETGGKPVFLRNLEDRLVDEYERLIMEAQLDTKVKPKPSKITWLRDGQEVESSDKFRIEYNEANGTLKLTLPSAQLSDKSRVTIKVENSYGVVETNASIGVQKKISQSKPQFLSDLGTITVSEGESLEKSVIISGEPKPSKNYKILFFNWIVFSCKVVHLRSTCLPDRRHW